MSVLDGERYLAAAIESILCQSLTEFEFVIVDDGSTDGTADILARQGDARVRVITLPENRGLTAALNHGLQHCRGGYVARQDSDDVSCGERLRRQAAFLEAHPEVAAVGTWGLQIDEDGHRIGVLKKQVRPDDLRAGLERENEFLHGSLMFRKAALEAVGGYRSYFRYAQDYDLTLRLSEKFDLANLPEPLYQKRHAQQAVSIRHAAEQKSYSDLARLLHEQRKARGSDDLEDGNPVSRTVGKLDSTDLYEKSLVHMYLRSDRRGKARPYILKSIRTSPFNVKHYLQYAFTFLNKGLQDKLVRLWDQKPPGA